MSNRQVHSVRSKSTPLHCTFLPPPQTAHGEGEGGKVGSHVPKAQELKLSGQSPRPCNTEGRGVRQTDRQIFCATEEDNSRCLMDKIFH